VGGENQTTDAKKPAEPEQNTQLKTQNAKNNTQGHTADDEKLNLLSTKDMANTGRNKKAQNEKIEALKQKLKRQEQVIADLRSQVTLQENELNKKSTGSGQTVVSDISMDEYQARYDEARSEFESRNYDLAIQLFESMLAASSTHPLAENAQYWIGECQYALRQYDAAIISFEKVFTFASPNKKDDAQFKLALCYIQKKENNKAREELNRFIDEFPKSEFLAKVNRLLEKM